MKKNKVLEVCSYYMGTKLYENLFQKLSEKGMEHDILYYCARETKLPPMPDNFIVSQPYRWSDRFIFSLKHKKVYANVKEIIDPDKYYMTHAHSLVSNGYISYCLKQDFKIPYITAVRNTDLFTFFRVMPHLIFLGRKILNEASGVVFLSPAYRDLTIEKYVAGEDQQKVYQKSIIIPNGIDDYYFEDPIENKKNYHDPIRLVYVGRVDDPNKNVITIVRACEILRKYGVNVKLTLVGRMNIKIFQKYLEKKDYIQYEAIKDKSGVREILRNHDIFVMPSRRETFGLVYVEAMSQGLPVIYTKGQGFDGHFSEGEVGYRVVYNNAKEIAHRILDIKKDYEGISQRAFKGARQFNWDDLSEKYVKIYEKIRNGE